MAHSFFAVFDVALLLIIERFPVASIVIFLDVYRVGMHVAREFETIFRQEKNLGLFPPCVSLQLRKCRL